MAQRGGSVVSTVRYGKQVWSPVSPRADMVIATETARRPARPRPAGRQGDAGLRHHGDRARQRAAGRDGLSRRPARGGRRASHPARRRRRRRRWLAKPARCGPPTSPCWAPPRTCCPSAQRPGSSALELAVPAKILEVNQRAFALGREAAAATRGGAVKVTQVTVFLENRSGRLAEIADILGRHGVNIRGFSTTEAAEYGIVRLIVPDPVARPRDPPQGGLHDPPLAGHLRGGARRAGRSCARARRASPTRRSRSTTSTASRSTTSVSRCTTSTAPSSCSSDKVTLLSDDQVKTL